MINFVKCKNDPKNIFETVFSLGRENNFGAESIPGIYYFRCYRINGPTSFQSSQYFDWLMILLSKTWWLGRDGGEVVSVFAFNYHGQSSNPIEDYT